MTLPCVTRITEGMLPRRSSSVCIFTAPSSLRTWPGEYRQAQVDHRGIQRVCGSLKFDSEAVGNVQLARGSDQRLGEVGVDAPVTNLICIRQSVARNATADAHVVKLRARRT